MQLFGTAFEQEPLLRNSQMFFTAKMRSQLHQDGVAVGYLITGQLAQQRQGRGCKCSWVENNTKTAARDTCFSLNPRSPILHGARCIS